MANEIGTTLVNSLTNSSFDIGNMAKVLAEADIATQRSIVDKGSSKANTEMDGLKYLEMNLEAFNTYVTDLTSPDLFLQKEATSNNESVLKVTANSQASTGSYSVISQQLAQSHTQVAEQTFSTQYASINSGTLSINVGGKVSDITVDSSNNTLEGLQKTINSGDYGVSAAVINNGGVYQLMFTSKETGAANQVSISSDNDIAGIDGSGGGLMTTVDAQDAVLNLNGVDIANSSNTFEDLIQGVTLNLQSSQPGVPTTIEISQDPTTVIDTVKSFVDVYNQLDTILDELGAYDASDYTEEELETEELLYYGDLAGNSTLRQIRSDLKETLMGSIEEVSGTVNSLGVIGIKSNLDGTLELDEDTLTDVATNNMASFAPLFAEGGYSSDGLINILEGSSRTEMGTYQLEITQTAARAELAMNATTASPSGDQQISGDRVNNSQLVTTLAAGASLDLTLDGVNQNVDLSALAGSFASKDELSQSIQRAINESFGVVYDGNGDPTSALQVNFGFDVAKSRFEIQSAAGEGNLSLNSQTGLTNQGFADANTYASEDLIDLTVGSLNFDIAVDDSDVASISLANGRYTGDELASVLASSINNSTEVTEKGNEVSIGYDGSALTFSSTRFGGLSKIELSNIDASLTDAGLVGLATTSATGQSVDGTITTDSGTLNIGAYADSKDGRIIKISDYAIIGGEAAEVRGLSFEVLGGDLGNRGDISFSKGFASRIEDTIQGFFEADTGVAARRYDVLQTKIDDYTERGKSLDERYEKLELKYRLQFSALQSILSQAEQTRSQLSAQFSNNN